MLINFVDATNDANHYTKPQGIWMTVISKLSDEPAADTPAGWSIHLTITKVNRDSKKNNEKTQLSLFICSAEVHVSH